MSLRLCLSLRDRPTMNAMGFSGQSTNTAALSMLLLLMMTTTILMQYSVTSFGIYDDGFGGVSDDVTSDLYSTRRTTIKWCRLCIGKGLLDSPSCRYCSAALDQVPPSSTSTLADRNMVLQLAERCCLALGISSCCQRRRSMLMVMEGGTGAIGVTKRGYETSYVPLEDLGNGMCSCCDRGTYNYFCCTNYCYGRK